MGCVEDKEPFPYLGNVYTLEKNTEFPEETAYVATRLKILKLGFKNPVSTDKLEMRYPIYIPKSIEIEDDGVYSMKVRYDKIATINGSFKLKYTLISATKINRDPVVVQVTGLNPIKLKDSIYYISAPIVSESIKKTGTFLVDWKMKNDSLQIELSKTEFR